VSGLWVSLIGYKQWNLHVLSAGGVIGLTAMRLHPQGIRSVILDSALGNRFKLRGPDVWGGQNRALEMVFAGCAADAACAAAYPNLRTRFYDRVHALRADPVVVNLPIQGGGTFALTVDGDLLLADASSCASDGPFCAPELPRALDAAADGDIASSYSGDTLAPDPPVDPFLAEGKSAVARCHDQIAFEPDSELRRAARELPEFREHLLTLRFIYIPHPDQAGLQALACWPRRAGPTPARGECHSDACADRQVGRHRLAPGRAEDRQPPPQLVLLRVPRDRPWHAGRPPRLPGNDRRCVRRRPKNHPRRELHRDDAGPQLHTSLTPSP
jgi:pimeloyl-ACP methyl ester carboxylesterase